MVGDVLAMVVVDGDVEDLREGLEFGISMLVTVLKFRGRLGHKAEIH